MADQIVAPGSYISIRKLRAQYDAHAPNVLRDYLKIMPKVKRRPARFEIIKELPDSVKYLELKTGHYTTTVLALLDDAYAEIGCVLDELRDWYDSIPENLIDAEIGSRLSDVISELEQIDEADIPLEMKGVKVVCFPLLPVVSRADRLAGAAHCLEAVRNIMGEGLSSDDNEDWKSACDEIGWHVDVLRAVDVPSMYG